MPEIVTVWPGSSAWRVPGLFASQTVMAMYSIYHPHFTPQRWQMSICFLVVTWLDLSLVLFGQRFLAKASTAIGIMLMLIWLVTMRVCAIMPRSDGSKVRK